MSENINVNDSNSYPALKKLAESYMNFTNLLNNGKNAQQFNIIGA